MHADAQAHVSRRNDGQIPARWLTGDTDYQKAAVLAACAWHDIKDPADPELTNCDLTHRANCIGVAESIIRGAKPDDTPFAQRAAELWETTKPTNEEIST